MLPVYSPKVLSGFCGQLPRSTSSSLCSGLRLVLSGEFGRQDSAQRDPQPSSVNCFLSLSVCVCVSLEPSTPVMPFESKYLQPSWITPPTGILNLLRTLLYYFFLIQSLIKLFNFLSNTNRTSEKTVDLMKEIKARTQKEYFTKIVSSSRFDTYGKRVFISRACAAHSTYREKVLNPRDFWWKGARLDVVWHDRVG